VPDRVVAAVVTYNRKELLGECVRAILVQEHAVERVLVVDNASSDGTEDLNVLRDPRVDYERLPENRGGAGGFARAVERAREVDAEWIWLMDDDAEPPPQALRTLLSSPPASDPGTAAVVHRVVNPDGTLQPGARGFLRGRPVALPESDYVDHPRVDYATFVGFCVRMAAARSIDPPKAEMFIWADDYEYCLRLRPHGDVRVVPESPILHKDVGEHFLTRRGRLVNRLTGWSYGSTRYAGFWKNIAGVRNYVWIQKEYLGESRLGAVRTVGQFVMKALLYDEKPLQRIPWIVRAAYDGRRGVFRNVTPHAWRARIGA
jgi:rhamnopyranosyl-N-acetylglucosaminyl-diphospho-decaprenol beta-1,3/1,4-galactofuranosyltransferase